MLFAITTLFTALAMAATAATFAIMGIMAIFAGLPYHALVMGTVIELGKVVGVSWIYRNWTQPTSIKYAMVPLVLIAMMLTSMGIFGLLSKAHLEQTASVGNNTAVIERLDQQIGRAELDISRAESALGQLDASIDEYIERGFVTRGLEARRAQQAERDGLRQIISESQQTIAELSDQRLELNQELQAVALEVGPVKYIAELVYGPGEDRLEEAVRWVIIAFIFVFDPMAILLLMAANYSFMQRGIYLEHEPDAPQPPKKNKKIKNTESEFTEPEFTEPEFTEPEFTDPEFESEVAHSIHKPRTEFVDTEPEIDEHPEQFVSRVMQKHQNPQHWQHTHGDQLVSPHGVIARNISLQDAQKLTDLALQVDDDRNHENKYLGRIGKLHEIVLRKRKDPQ